MQEQDYEHRASCEETEKGRSEVSMANELSRESERPHTPDCNPETLEAFRKYLDSEDASYLFGIERALIDGNAELLELMRKRGALKERAQAILRGDYKLTAEEEDEAIAFCQAHMKKLEELAESSEIPELVSVPWHKRLYEGIVNSGSRVSDVVDGFRDALCDLFYDFKDFLFGPRRTYPYESYNQEINTEPLPKSYAGDKTRTLESIISDDLIITPKSYLALYDNRINNIESYFPNIFSDMKLEKIISSPRYLDFSKENCPEGLSYLDSSKKECLDGLSYIEFPPNKTYEIWYYKN